MSATRKAYNPLSPFKVLHYQLAQSQNLLEAIRDQIQNQFPELLTLKPEELLQMGAVYVDQKRVRQDVPLKAKQHLKVHLQPKRFPRAKLCRRDGIVHEDEDLLVFNKPSGVPIHATRDNYFENALEQIKIQTAQKLYVTHRLDTETQGLCIFAKTPEVQREINFAFSRGQVKKIYWAQTARPLERGEMHHHTSPEPSIPRVFALKPLDENWKICSLNILKCEPCGQNFASTIQLLTGRTHQIRGQLSLIQNPILGDTIYGGALHPELQLRCIEMEFGLRGRDYSFSLGN